MSPLQRAQKATSGEDVEALSKRPSSKPKGLSGMSRSYDTHGICTLQRRQKRRRNGPLDGRTRAGQRAEALRSELIRDKGGQDISAVTLATIELCVRDAAWLDECDEAIAAFLKKRPEVRKNPKSLATLYGYRQPMANALSKNLAILGPDKVAQGLDLARRLTVEQREREAAKTNGGGR
jgi:hypothetical protein